LADPAVALFGEPEVAVGADRDAGNARAAGAGGLRLADEDTGGRHLTDLATVRTLLGEPEVAEGPGGDGGGHETRRDGERGGDGAGAGIGEPQVAVGAGGDAEGVTVRRRAYPRRTELGDAPGGSRRGRCCGDQDYLGGHGGDHKELGDRCEREPSG